MIKNSSVGYATFYASWANICLFIISNALPTLKLPIKSHPSLWYLFISDVVLVSNYLGRKGEAIELISLYMINFIYKTVNSSHLKNLRVIQNIKKSSVPIDLHIFWLNLSKANYTFPHLFLLSGKTDF